MDADGCGCLGLWLEIWNWKMEGKGVGADFMAVGLAGDPAGRSLPSLFVLHLLCFELNYAFKNIHIKNLTSRYFRM